MRIISTALLALCFLFSVPLFSQEADSKFYDEFVEAARLMEEGYKKKSLVIWKRLAEAEPENANVNYKTGYCYLLQNNGRKDALPYLEKAVALQTNDIGKFNKSDYNPVAPREVNAPLESVYYLGEAYLLNYKLDKAKQAFTSSLDVMGAKHRLADDAQRGIDMTENAKYQLANERKDLVISNIGNVINSEFNDFSPVLSADENALFFTSRRIRTDSSNANLFDFKDIEYYEDIYVSFKDRNGNWQTPELLNINDASQHSASINVSINGQRLFIYNGKVGNGDLFESKLVGEVFTTPEALNSEVNTKYWETHCALSADEQTLYFISEIPGGFGKRDIYRCVILPNGQWSKALNLGPMINTKYDEDAVFIHPDGRTLYFSSKGHSSMGGFDVFKTTTNNEGAWSEPVNIGYPINTVEDDVFFITSADNRRAYFSSGREGGLGQKDIYIVDLPAPPVEEQVNLTLLKGYLTAPAGETLPENVTIVITDNETGEVKSYKPRSKDGAFVAILTPCKDYTIKYSLGDEVLKEEELNVGCETAYQEIQREILLAPVNIGGGEVVEVEDNKFSGSDAAKDSDTAGEENVAEYQRHFGYNEKDIETKDAEYAAFIKKLAQILADKGEVNVISEGSASRVPTKTWKTNKRLANKRATDAKETILASVTELGLDKDKITFISTNGLIQGPRYKYDFKSNRLVYEQYQYVKMIAK
ncbi:MAG: hypothetical protein ACI8XB_001900 [Patiriisocius sp.]|jgi:hypothetical protein